jgi:uncharacterized protein (TIGR02453 family)
MTFSGFSASTIRFLAGLSRNNDKRWFDAHRDDYETYFVDPARAFVEAIAPRLKKLDRDVQAVPTVNGSILRIHRDVRFSKDKTPYKDHLDLWFWSGDNRGWDGSGFFFRLTPTRLILGAGTHVFAPPVLNRYRKQVLNEKRGAALAKLVATLQSEGFAVGGETYKKTPRGVPADHARATLLRHGGLYATWEGKHPKELGTVRCVDFAATHFGRIAPVHAWLAGLAE